MWVGNENKLVILDEKKKKITGDEKGFPSL